MADENDVQIAEEVEDLEVEKKGPQEFLLGDFSVLPNGVRFKIKNLLVNGQAVKGGGQNVVRPKDVLTLVSESGDLGKIFTKAGFFTRGQVFPENLITTTPSNLDIEFEVPEALSGAIEEGQTFQIFLSGSYGNGVVFRQLVFLGGEEEEAEDKEKKQLAEKKQRQAEDFNKQEASDFAGLMANALHGAPADAISIMSGGVLNPLLNTQLKNAIASGDNKALKSLVEQAVKTGDRKTIEAVIQGGVSAEQKEILSSALVKIEGTERVKGQQNVRASVQVSTKSTQKTKTSVEARVEAEDLEAQAPLLEETEETNIRVENRADINTQAQASVQGEVKGSNNISSSTVASGPNTVQASVKNTANFETSGQSAKVETDSRVENRLEKSQSAEVKQNASQNANLRTSQSISPGSDARTQQENSSTSSEAEVENNTENEISGKQSVKADAESVAGPKGPKNTGAPTKAEQNLNLKAGLEAEAKAPAGNGGKKEDGKPEKNEEQGNVNAEIGGKQKVQGQTEDEKPKGEDNKQEPKKEPEAKPVSAEAEEETSGQKPNQEAKEQPSRKNEAGQEILSRLKNREKRNLMQGDLDRARAMGENNSAKELGQDKEKDSEDPKQKKGQNKKSGKTRPSINKNTVLGAAPGLGALLSPALQDRVANKEPGEGLGSKDNSAGTQQESPDANLGKPVGEPNLKDKQPNENLQRKEPKEAAPGISGEEDLSQPVENLQPQVEEPKKAESSVEVQAAMQKINQLVDKTLLAGCYWVWGMAIPSFGLSILLGAIVGDFISLFKDWLINRAVQSINLPDKIKDQIGKLSSDIKIGIQVKAHILLMNLITLAILILFFVFFLYVGCNTPVGIVDHKMSYIGSSYPEVCEAVDSMNIGSITKTQGTSGQVQGASQSVEAGVNAR